MNQINEELVSKLAELAKIELSNSQIVSYTQQLDQFLSYAKMIQEVDLSGYEPMIHPSNADSRGGWREDIIQEKIKMPESVFEVPSAF